MTDRIDRKGGTLEEGMRSLEYLQGRLDAALAQNADLQKRLREKESLHLVAQIRAAGLRIEAVRMRLESGEFSPITFTMTHDNDVKAHMGESAAKLFARFVTDTLSGGTLEERT